MLRSQGCSGQRRVGGGEVDRGGQQSRREGQGAGPWGSLLLTQPPLVLGTPLSGVAVHPSRKPHRRPETSVSPRASHGALELLLSALSNAPLPLRPASCSASSSRGTASPSTPARLPPAHPPLGSQNCQPHSLVFAPLQLPFVCPALCSPQPHAPLGLGTCCSPARHAPLLPSTCPASARPAALARTPSPVGALCGRGAVCVCPLQNVLKGPRHNCLVHCPTRSVQHRARHTAWSQDMACD